MTVRESPHRHRVSRRGGAAPSIAVFVAALIGQAAHGAELGDKLFGDEVGFAGVEACRPALIKTPDALKIAPDVDSSALATRIEADSIEANSIDTSEGGENDQVVLRGNASLVQARRGVSADKIVYHRAARRAVAEGNVVFHTPNGDEIRAAALDVTVDTFIGEGTDIEIKIAEIDVSKNDKNQSNNDEIGSEIKRFVRARVSAQSVTFEEGGAQRLKQVVMSSCPEGNQDVLLSAAEITLDHAAGIGSAKSMVVKFKQVPIFYFPAATFPLNNRRKTGFLFPSAGYADDSGVILEAPYYINIAPQYDATLTPRILSKRGAQVFGQFRYLSAHGGGAVRGEFLPSDRQFNGQDRHAFGYQHGHRFGPDWRASVDAQTVSDSAYLRDFSNEADLIASSYVQQKAKLDYFGQQVRFSARALAHDAASSSQPGRARPHELAPQLTLAFKPVKLGGFEVGADAEYSRFLGDERGRDDEKISAARWRFKPFISAPWRRGYGYIVPKASLQTIRYSLRDDAGAAGRQRSPSVSVPMLSLDSGLFFEREFEGDAARYSQTLEPRLFYVKIPRRREQHAFPNFDSSASEYDSFGHFFRENRFFGGDRVGDAEQLAFGISSRIINQRSGRQRLKLSLGQIFYLKDRIIGLQAPLASGDDSATQDSSGVIAEVAAAVSEQWNVSVFSRWGDRDNTLDALRLAADYRHSQRRGAAFAYTFKDGVSEQLNAALHAPLGAWWQFQGSLAYSLEENATRSAAVGIAFEGCCWAARFGLQRYLDGVGERKNRFIFTLELDDLGRLGSRL